MSQNIGLPSKKSHLENNLACENLLLKSTTAPAEHEDFCQSGKSTLSVDSICYTGRANRVTCSANTISREQNNLAFCNTIPTVSVQIKRDSNETLAFKESPSTTVLCVPILLFTNGLFTVRCYASPVK